MGILDTGPVSVPYRTTAGHVSPHQFCDSGQLVSAQLQSRIADQINGTIRWRRKQFAAFHMPLTQISGASGIGANVRWRFAFHTGMYARRIRVDLVTTSLIATPSAPSVDVQFVGPTTLDLNFPANAPGTSANQPSSWSFATKTIDCASDAYYEGVILDNSIARTISACISEEGAVPDLGNGYMDPRAQVLAPIYSGHRQIMLERLRELRRCNGPHLFNISDPGGVYTTTSGTAHNLGDGVTTSPSATSPGLVLDMRYLNRRSRPSVKCYLAAYANNTIAPGGVLSLKDSTGVTIAMLGGFSSAGEWKKVAFDMPATYAKYDLFLQGDGSHDFTIDGVSCYTYDGANP